MPAVSKSQQRLFGAVHACQKTRKCASPAVKKTAKSIKAKDAEDFASTKHKGLPNKKEKDKKDESRLSFSNLWERIQSEKKQEKQDLNEMGNYRELPVEIDGSPVYVSADNKQLVHDNNIMGQVENRGTGQHQTIFVTRNYEQDK